MILSSSKGERKTKTKWSSSYLLKHTSLHGAKQSMDLLRKCSASSTKLSVDSPLSTVAVQSPLSSGKEPLANLTFEGVLFITVVFFDGDTGAEHRLVGTGGDDNGYWLEYLDWEWLPSLGVVVVHTNFCDCNNRV